MTHLDVPTLLWCLLALALAAAVSFGVSPLVKRLAAVVGAIDVPKDERRMHSAPIPRLGGLAIFLGFLASVLILGDITAEMRGILLGAVVIVLLGVLDDIFDLRWWVKLLVQIGAAILPVAHGVVVEILSNPFFFLDIEYFNLGLWGPVVSVVWIVGITNSVNFIDGLDGLACGVSAIASATFLAIALLVPSPAGVPLFVAALTGACVGFLPYNLNPAKMFIGDTGATFLGFILATLSIQGLFKFYAIVSFLIPFLVLGLPIFDAAFAILRRLSKGRSPMSPDRGHVHHRLIDMGFTQKQSVAILYGLSALLGLSAVVLATSGEARTVLLLLAVIAAFLIGLRLNVNKQTPPDAAADPGPEGGDSETPGDSDDPGGEGGESP